MVPNKGIESPIGEMFVAAISAMEQGSMTLSEFNTLVDNTERDRPGDERRAGFFAAIRELAVKVSNTPRNAISDETKHAISVKFVDSMNEMNAGKLTLAEFISIVDETEREYPSDNRFEGDDRQKNFYAAIRKLAAGSAAQTAEWKKQKEQS